MRKEIAYFNGLNSNSADSINKRFYKIHEARICPGDMLSITVTGLDPLAVAPFNLPLVSYATPNASYPLSWTMNTSQTLTAGLIIFYWDLNVKNSLISPLTPYYPSGTNNTYDSTSPLIGYGPFVDASSGHNYWTTTSAPAVVSYTYDTSFSGSSVLLSDQIV